MIIFCGTWHVRRRIVDLPTGEVTQFEGTARISPDRFDERGILRRAGGTFAAQRTYRLAFGSGSVEVRFEDGRPFIALTSESSQRLEHVCGDDHYRGRFLFAGDGRWMEAWSVRGPRKTYRSVSRYRSTAP
ncbi:DUF6314 family protein [Labrys wisconsinensis]|uniref:DUF6314 domain-containing protein n=1 Tax=Labrys wisconsinensis TaxID=425677 RepID=A0ABU0JA08_9HYPH|nr:DUF6314 family protein [Labrys wisconsinensis]MDQ0471101.1 hypothetical protein [Labrys wisconsinensis]